MADSESGEDKSVKRTKSKMDKTIIVAIIAGTATIIGSGIGAWATVHTTIKNSDSGITDNTRQLADLEQKIKALTAKADDLKKPAIPVGTIVASLLTPQQFAIEADDADNFDTFKSKWMWAGQEKPVPGTDWAGRTENASIPDLRGVFLRDGTKSGTEKRDRDCNAPQK
jgi:hypothetical protein